MITLGMQVLHAYKACYAELFGGIPEAIRILTSSHSGNSTSKIVAPRVRGLRRRTASEHVSIELTGSLGTLASTPIAPSYPFALAREASAADVVALHVPFPLNDLGVWLGIPERTALVVHWHAEIVGRPILSRPLSGLINKTLTRADRIVVSSERIVQNSKTLAPYLSKCRVIPFGVDTAFWGMLGDGERDEVDKIILAHPRLVLAVGRLVSYKGFNVLVEALARIDASAIIVGAGSQAGRLRRLIASYGIADRVSLGGSVSRERLRVLLHAARVFAFPSLTTAETFGIAQIEAMAAGLPIVNTALPSGVPTVARHGIEALTVPPGDAAKLAEAIGHLLATPQHAAALGRAGKQRAIAEFDQSPFIDRVHALYAESVFARREQTRDAIGGVAMRGAALPNRFE